MISSRRGPTAREIYARIGGRSPLLEQTQAQAAALEQTLATDWTVKVWPCMRYWHPRSGEVAAEVAAFRPDDVVLIPLYPQFSTTTTASSLKDWRRAAKRAGVAAEGTAICCYPIEDGFIAAMAEATAHGIAAAETKGPVRVLFSAHGLPKRIVDRGDPYPSQVSATAEAVVAALGRPGLDWLICYQSRVGPLEWIGPATDAEIMRAGAEGKAIVVVPLAFVSEHSETLVELDIEYRHLAERTGAAAYVRIPTVQSHPRFVAGMADLVRKAARHPGTSWLRGTSYACDARGTRCPCAAAAPAKIGERA
jgi:ferrochelatase